MTCCNYTAPAALQILGVRPVEGLSRALLRQFQSPVGAPLGCSALLHLSNPSLNPRPAPKFRPCAASGRVGLAPETRIRPVAPTRQTLETLLLAARAMSGKLPARARGASRAEFSVFSMEGSMGRRLKLASLCMGLVLIGAAGGFRLGAQGQAGA